MPLRIEIGPRDITSRKVAVTRRDRGPRDKEFIDKEEFIREFTERLDEIQASLYRRALDLRERNLREIATMDEFTSYFAPPKADEPGIHGGFAACHWAGTAEDEERLQKELKVTIRCIPDDERFARQGTCFLTGKPSARMVIFAKAY